MTGLELRVRRTEAEVRVKELAQAMGVTPSRISYIESRRVPTAEAVDRYLTALNTCTTKSTPPTHERVA